MLLLFFPDIDECNSTLNECHPYFAICENFPGGYNCSCFEGYKGDGFTCEDEDECVELPCHQNASCMNYNGSFECVCKTGYSGNGFNCTGIIM